MKSTIFENARLFLLDLDGTVYLGGKLIENARQKIAELRQKGKIVCFLTNNSSRSRSEYVQKINNLGIDCVPDDIITSADAAIFYIKKHLPDRKFFVLGTSALEQQISESGICVRSGQFGVAGSPDGCGDTAADALLLGYDTELTYSKLCEAQHLLLNGAPYIATHADKKCPASPVYLPDAGSIIALLEISSGRSPDVICGKPFSPIAEFVEAKFNLQPQQIVMVGDRLYTDIAFAAKNGFCGVLVLSGETTAAEAAEADIKADLVLNSIADIEI